MSSYRAEQSAVDNADPRRACEQAIVEGLRSLITRVFPGRGHFEFELVGEYPDTELHIAGRGLKTGRPQRWTFPLWKGQMFDDVDPGDVEETVVMIFAGMAD